MNLNHLKYFEAICQTWNFTKAAETLHISQPSLSAAIQKLEDDLHVKLFERDNKKVILTREGAIFLRECGKVLDEVRHMEAVMRDLGEDAGKKLVFACPATSGAWLWPVLLEDFGKACPDIQLEIQDLSTYDIIRALKKDEIELGYGVLESNACEDLRTMPVARGEVRLLMHADNPLTACDRISYEQLRDQQFFMYKKGSSYAERVFLEKLRELGISVKLQYVREQATVFNLVAENMGFAVVLDETELLMNNQNLSLRSFVEPIEYDTGFLWRRDRYLSKSSMRLMDFLRKR